MHPNLRCASQNCTGSTNLMTGPGRVYFVTVIWDATANSFQLRDGTTISGPIIFSASRMAVAVAGDDMDHYVFPQGLKFSDGLAYVRVNAIPNAFVGFGRS